MFTSAGSYERFMGRWSRLLAPALVDFASVREGDLVLDAGSGTGALSQAVVRATRTGRVTGVDRSQSYVGSEPRDWADGRADFEVGDIQSLRFPDSTFDKALSQLVINFVPEPARAVKEMARVTKPGGLVAAAVWDYAEGMEMLRVFWDEAIASDPNVESLDEAHMPLCTRGELGELWRQQGLTEVHEAPLAVAMSFESFDDYWAPFLLGQGPAGAYVVSLPKARQEALARRLRERLLGDRPDQRIEMPARAWAVRGKVPSPS